MSVRRSELPTPRKQRRNLRSRQVLILSSVLFGLGMALLVILPFALAGRTGNALWIAAPVLVTLIYVTVRETRRCLAYYRSLWPAAWLPALAYASAALIVTVSLASLLSLAPVSSPLNWSLGSLFNVGSDAGANGFAIPLSSPLIAIFYTPAAILALPLLAWWEEDIFRRGTKGIRSASVRSFLFGLLHITAGVSLGGCLSLGCAGFIFTSCYWRALRDPRRPARRNALPEWVRHQLLPGREGPSAGEQYAVFRTTQAHLVYNAVGVALIVIAMYGPFHIS